MDVLFENTCYYTKNNLYEMSKNTMKRWVVIYLHVATFIFFLVGLIAILFLVGADKLYGIVSIAVAVFIWYRLYSAPRKSAALAHSRTMELYHAEIESHVLFYDDYFIQKNPQSNGETKLQYGRITKVQTTKNLILLMLPERLIVILDRRGFSAGTENEFINFIKTKALIK